MEHVEQNKQNEEVREVKEKKELTEFGKILKADDTMEKMDALVKNLNESVIGCVYALAKADETCSLDDKLELAERVITSQKEIESALILHHHYVMALYAGYISTKHNIPDNPDSPAHTTYW